MPAKDPLAAARDQYDQYVRLVEIADLAELAREPEVQVDYSVPPVGLVFID